ncbi:hypothetical protein [Novosphingobium terrae]|uniref:hypothetical protein n=1 Tax=Novosphingobium terrae TaxID=2726189 RepID=UPI00197E4F31|nr:hypothetical protein [Novosphingobium terrae]
MNTQDEIAALKAEVQRLSEQVEAQKTDGFRGSAAERMLAMEYELIPDYMKTPKAIRVQKQINTWGVPAFFVIIAVAIVTVWAVCTVKYV